ncbi:MAG: hypothetical protein F4Y16_15495 [Holophagales bacterium]|nr:hypothetical protein [Holophagales bacterium]MYH27207.1 hypothetical protein [Holophagales bacterium]
MKTRTRSSLALALLLAGAAGVAPASGQEDEKVNYLTQVKPILEAFCYECHGEDRSRREADLRLDIKEEAFKDLGGFPNIAPGDPADSELYIRVSSEFLEMRMPPYEAGTELAEEQIETIRLWILQGAEWPEDDETDG